MSDFTADEQRIIDEVNTRLAPHGGVVTGFGPEAIGVMGDARRVGIGIIITLPLKSDDPKVSEISNDITNNVRGVGRVLLDI